MKTEPSFNDILNSLVHVWERRKSDETVISISLPLTAIDPLLALSSLGDEHKFRFLWDRTPSLCFSAVGRCQHFDLSGPRRFELAQRFGDSVLGRLLDLTPEAPLHARPKVLYAFSFFDNFIDRQDPHGGSLPAAQAILPIWQLSREKDKCWLRLNAVVNDLSEARTILEKVWLMRENLIQGYYEKEINSSKFISNISSEKNWESQYRTALLRGIELVDSCALEKIVLAVRQSILLSASINVLEILYRLREQQSASCRFLWEQDEQSFFGASPERLLTNYNGRLWIDALAGTAPKGDDGSLLYKSTKDLYEHELVVNSIIEKLTSIGVQPRRPKYPRLARYGNLLHLHSPISAVNNFLAPLQIVERLHPTPAVAGLPLLEAMNWLRTLEPFERGFYASPIGWVDNAGNAEFRVAIRCGNLQGSRLELTAGAGLVRGSVFDKEIQEVSLKLAVLVDQLNLQPRAFNNFSIT